MPYIKPLERAFYDKKINELDTILKNAGRVPGHYNYVIFRLMLRWFLSETRYDTICKIMGTLRCVSDEFYRQWAVPYEKEKESLNGHIYS